MLVDVKAALSIAPEGRRRPGPWRPPLLALRWSRRRDRNVHAHELVHVPAHDLVRVLARDADLVEDVLRELVGVGQALGISDSRVSQRLESIVQCLRARMSFAGASAEFV